MTWMDPEIVILSEVSQTEKGKHHTISILCRILKMVQMSLRTEQKQAHRHIKQTYGFQGGKWSGGINWEIGIDMYTLLYIKQIINKDLLHSTHSSTQFSVMTYMGKEPKKEWMCVHGVLKARILKWFAIPFSGIPHFVRTLHHDLSVSVGPTWHGSQFH